jgi:hypothetical protein
MSRINLTAGSAYTRYTEKRGDEKNHVSFKEKCEIMEKMTGRRYDENTPHIMSKESTARLSYMGEFLRSANNSDAGNEQNMKDTAAKYNQLREEILAKYADDENERLNHLGQLNQAFEMALKNANKLPVFQPKALKLEVQLHYDKDEANKAAKENERKAKEAEEYNKAMKDIYDSFNRGMNRHIDRFYESFIKNIESGDFETAYSESLSLLTDSQSNSAGDISYNDMLLIRGTMMDQVIDEEGKNAEQKYSDFGEVLNAIAGNDEISEIIRQAITDRLKELGLQA